MPCWMTRLGWFLAIWVASVGAMALLAGVLRWWIH